MVRSSALLTADSAQGALFRPPGIPGTPSQPPLPASSHSAAGASPPEIYLCSCSKSGLEILIFFFFALSIATHSCRSQQSREGLGAPPCETPTHSCKAGKGWGHPHVRPRRTAARGAGALSARGVLSRDASSPTSSFCTFGACSLTFTDEALLLHLNDLHDLNKRQCFLLFRRKQAYSKILSHED